MQLVAEDEKNSGFAARGVAAWVRPAMQLVAEDEKNYAYDRRTVGRADAPAMQLVAEDEKNMAKGLESQIAAIHPQCSSSRRTRRTAALGSDQRIPA